MSRATSAPTVKAALLVMIAGAVDADVLVSWGHPGFDLPADVVAVGDIDADSQPGPISPLRAREETLDVAVTISCYSGGGPEVQQSTTERAYGLLSALHDALTTDPSIGGTCRTAALVRHQMREEDDPEVLAQGRVTEIVAIVATATRI